MSDPVRNLKPLTSKAGPGKPFQLAQAAPAEKSTKSPFSSADITAVIKSAPGVNEGLVKDMMSKPSGETNYRFDKPVVLSDGSKVTGAQYYSASDWAYGSVSVNYTTKDGKNDTKRFTISPVRVTDDKSIPDGLRLRSDTSDTVKGKELELFNAIAQGRLETPEDIKKDQDKWAAIKSRLAAQDKTYGDTVEGWRKFPNKNEFLPETPGGRLTKKSAQEFHDNSKGNLSYTALYVLDRDTSRNNANVPTIYTLPSDKQVTVSSSLAMTKISITEGEQKKTFTIGAGTLKRDNPQNGSTQGMPPATAAELQLINEALLKGARTEAD